MDEVQRIIFQVENEQKLRDYNAQLKAQKETLEQLLALQKGGALSPAQAASLTRAAEGAGESTRQIQQATNALRSVGGNPQGMVQFGYALEDFFAVQGGMAQKMGAISNNLQMLAMSMGIGGKWFLAVTGIIVGLKMLSQNAQGIADLMMGVDSAKANEAAEKMKGALEQWKGQQAGGTFAQQGMAKDAKEVVGADPSALNKGLYDVLATTGGLPLSPGQQRRQLASDAMMAVWNKLPDWTPGKQGAQEQAQKLRETILQEQAAGLATDAQKPGPEGDVARRTLKQLKDKFPGAFPSGFGDKIDRLAKGMPLEPSAGERKGRDDQDPTFVGPPMSAQGAPMPFGNDMTAMPAYDPDFMKSAIQKRTDIDPRPRQEVQEEMREAARRRKIGRQIGRGEIKLKPAAADPSQLGLSNIEGEISRVEGLLASPPQWATAQEVNALSLRLHKLYVRLDALLQFQAKTMGGQQFMGGFSAIPQAWPPQGGG